MTVLIVPEAKDPGKRQRLMHALQISVAPHVFNPSGVYDGNKLFYTSHALETQRFSVHGSNQTARQEAPGWYEIRMTRTTGEDVRPEHVKELMTRGPATPKTATAVNLLQLLLRQHANQASPNTGRAYFSPQGKQQLQGLAVELWRGFYQSVRPTIGKMLVTVDTTVATMYMSGNMIDVSMAVLQSRNVRDLHIRDPHSRSFKALERHFKNRLITVGGRTKTVRGLEPGPVGRYEFPDPKAPGQPITIAAHYQRAHNYTLKQPDTFGVITSGRNAPFKVVLPLEICNVSEGQAVQEEAAAAGDSLHGDLLDDATPCETERLSVVRQARPGDLRSPVQEYAQSEILKEAGMEVDHHAITLSGRLLQVPRLIYGGRRVEPREGAWNVLNSRFSNPKKMKNWGVVNFDGQSIDRRLMEKIIRDLVDCCRNLGMEISQPPQDAIRVGVDVKRLLDEICTALGGPSRIEMIIVLLPAKADDIRTKVKYYGDVKMGIRTNCLRQDKVRNAKNQYYNNVALKLNARLGGLNASVDAPVLEELKKAPNRPSVTSLVWSHDMNGSQYCATSGVQHPRVEIIADLKAMFSMAIRMFGRTHNTPPAQIFFYRDGVSEGEFDKKALQELWAQIPQLASKPKPKLTFIVVGKRHHVVFFPAPNDSNVGDKTGNCRAGLVVDRGLSNPHRPDFYLQSHAAIKGTSRSGHYTVLQDENFGNNIGKLQELSFALCHVYSKATRSVSIPAPVYYADLVCARGKFHIDPALDHMDFEGSTASGGSGEAFNLDKWTEVYGAINDNIRGSMYFL
ncbi:argonaute-like protein [Mycena rebaudengoi]|nr:argonaute-like protein [Mycena rebaudengoi]